MLFLSIPLAQIFAFVSSFQLGGDGMFFHIPAGMVTYLWASCKLFGMPIVHHAAGSSNSSPSHPRSSTGCSLFVCLMFQFDRLSRDGTELQHCA